MLGKLFNALQRSRSGIAGMFKIFAEGNPSEPELEDLEGNLLQSDMGYDLVQEIIGIAKRFSSTEFIHKVKNDLISKLPIDSTAIFYDKPSVILIIGVNGSGKTTSAAKLAYLYKQLGLEITLVAADTYRAAAIDQLKIWSERVDCRLICNERTSDPVSVIYDGLESAMSNNSDLVLIDTAGRLHTSKNLMMELDKMYRVIESRFSNFNIATLITIDGTIGQNSLSQAKEFQKHRKLDGAILSKLDGTAKGGIVFPLYQDLGIPVKFIGVGESLTDMELFKAESYVDALFGVI
ncbi:MAG: signal recognition particle-docking protein FtsY [Candidatus Neomarinimicrobiota bacterium]